MGALGTKLNINDETKIVITKVIGKEDTHEIIHVYGNNEDFDANRDGFFPMILTYSKEKVNKYLHNRNTRNLPVYTCEISHDSKVMTKEEAIKRIFNTTELWDYN